MSDAVNQSSNTSDAGKSDRVDGDRIAKVMARAGLCSRREAERWIVAGRVAVDGEVLDGPAFVVPAGASVTVDGKPLSAPTKTRLWRYHKPRGILTTHADPQGRPTVFDQLPKNLPRVIAVGRLDIASEGLLLLTNDGALARHLELPKTGWTRRYRVRVHGRVDAKDLAALAKGVTVSGVNYGAIDAVLERQTGANAWLSVGLREGRNREVRRVMEHLGYQVNRLIRVAYGPFQLGNLVIGGIDEVPARIGADQLPDFFAKPASQSPLQKTATIKPSQKKPAQKKPVQKKMAPKKPAGSSWAKTAKQEPTKPRQKSSRTGRPARNPGKSPASVSPSKKRAVAAPSTGGRRGGDKAKPTHRRR